MLRHRSAVLIALVIASCVLGTRAVAQETGTIQGTITRADGGAKLSGVAVRVQGTGLETVTGTDGSYTLTRVPAGEQTLLVRWVGFVPREAKVTVQAGAPVRADVALEARPIMLSEIVVSTASRAPERIVEAPAAVTQIDTRLAQSVSLTGQAPLVIANVPGVDVVQSGVNDINVNTRGFNSSLNRRVLVLQDGRDLAVAFLGSQEWNALSTSLDDMGRIEMVRGPGSALYGANAFSGVLSITTPAPREIVGTKMSIGAGELSTFRGDARHAGILADGRFGYKLSGGYNRSDTWSRSRTAIDSLDMRREYTPAVDPTTVPRNFERSPLNGQTLDPTTRAAIGDRKDLVNAYGTARFDYYANNGSIGTIEGGGSQVQNEIFVTGIGRVQILKAFRPWVRTNWAANNFNVMAWYSGRRAPDSTATSPTVNHRVLSSGARLADVSDIYHVEGQYNRGFAADRARVVVGASFRNYHEDTKGTLMDPANDNRNDKYYSGYGQLEYRPTRQLRLVGAARFDDGDLFKPQFSPKAGLVYAPTDRHSVRLTFNRAFQTPNYSEFFLRAAVAAPNPGPRTLEVGLENYFTAVRASAPAAATAANVPASLAWDFPAATQALALGNKNLDVEKVTGFEFGYKGDVSTRLFVTADFYYNRINNFVTDLLGAVNPDYPQYSLTSPTDVPTTLTNLDAALAAAGLPPTHPLRAPIPVLRANYLGLAAAFGNRLATLPTGERAVVVSYTNAGKVNERGVEVGLGVLLTNELKADGSYTFFDFSVVAGSQQVGDSLLPNTPKHKGSLGLSYNGRQGVDASISVKVVDQLNWAAGVFSGSIPSSQTVNVSLGYRLNNYVRVNLVATNVFDQQRYQLYGGSVIGRRVLGGITATF
ncbi:MAG: TonB-dependent receptor [Gemmatimonadetes bacterium]|nr:TonB-dependent receptor [Gemmatimonadota bacterium]